MREIKHQEKAFCVYLSFV